MAGGPSARMVKNLENIGVKCGGFRIASNINMHTCIARSACSWIGSVVMQINMRSSSSLCIGNSSMSDRIAYLDTS